MFGWLPVTSHARMRTLIQPVEKGGNLTPSGIWNIYRGAFWKKSLYELSTKSKCACARQRLHCSDLRKSSGSFSQALWFRKLCSTYSLFGNCGAVRAKDEFGRKVAEFRDTVNRQIFLVQGRIIGQHLLHLFGGKTAVWAQLNTCFSGVVSMRDLLYDVQHKRLSLFSAICPHTQIKFIRIRFGFEGKGDAQNRIIRGLRYVLEYLIGSHFGRSALWWQNTRVNNAAHSGLVVVVHMNNQRREREVMWGTLRVRPSGVPFSFCRQSPTVSQPTAINLKFRSLLGNIDWFQLVPSAGLTVFPRLSPEVEKTPYGWGRSSDLIMGHASDH